MDTRRLNDNTLKRTATPPLAFPVYTPSIYRHLKRHSWIPQKFLFPYYFAGPTICPKMREDYLEL